MTHRKKVSPRLIAAYRDRIDQILTTVPSSTSFLVGAILAVDLGISDASPGPGATTNDLQAGFVGLDAPQTSSSGGNDNSTVTSVSDTFSGIGVAVAGGTQWRDRHDDITGTALDDVLEEFIYATGNTLTLTLTGLTDGQEYTITTFHHDRNSPGPDSTWTIDTGSGPVSHGSVLGTTGLTPMLSQDEGLLTSTFTAGTDPVVLAGTLDAAIVVLNGFILSTSVDGNSSQSTTTK